MSVREKVISSSYPYFNIARDYQVPYEVILGYVGMIDGTFDNGRFYHVREYFMGNFEEREPWAFATRMAFGEEKRRRQAQ